MQSFFLLTFIFSIEKRGGGTGVLEEAGKKRLKKRKTEVSLFRYFFQFFFYSGAKHSSEEERETPFSFFLLFAFRHVGCRW